MAASITRLSGEEWQLWANQLLACHYGPAEYQTVPDNDKGDAGIEGFTITDGHTYQAYGCEEPLCTTERYKAQQAKMTRDINKFISNRAVLQKVFGTVKITRWVLFVPYYDSKEIVAHATKKTREVKSASLPYVADNFCVKVSQESDFPVARDRLISAKTRTILVNADELSPSQVYKWASSNTNLTKILQDKIERLPTLQTDALRQCFHEKVLRWYLEGQSIVDALREYPEVYDKVIQTKDHRENFLVMSTVSGGTPQEMLTSSINDLLKSLHEEIGELHSFSIESLTYWAIADWLLRCPLDFPARQCHD